MSSAAAKIPVLKTITYAYAFVFVHLRQVLTLSLVPVTLAAAALYFSVVYYFNGLIGFVRGENTNGLGPAFAAMGGSVLLMLVLYALLATSLVRFAMGMSDGSPRLGLGRTETRMVGAMLRFYLLFMFIVVIASLIGGFVVGFIIAGNRVGDETPEQVFQHLPGSAAVSVAVLGLAAAIFLFYTLLRMSFFLASSVVDGEAKPLGRAWEMGRGNVLRIILVAIALAVPLILLQFLAQYLIIGADSFSAVPQPKTLEEMVSQLTVERDNFLPTSIISAVANLFLFGLGCAAQAYAYRALVSVPTTHRPVEIIA